MFTKSQIFFINALTALATKIDFIRNTIKFLIVVQSLCVSDSLQSHGLKHARLPYPSLPPRTVQTHVH